MIAGLLLGLVGLLFPAWPLIAISVVVAVVASAQLPQDRALRL